MARKAIRGIQASEDVGPKLTRRDVRSFSDRIGDMAQSGEVLTALLSVILVSMLVFPAFIEEIFVVGFLLFAWVKSRKFTLAYRMPQASRLLDYDDPKPNGAPSLASGIGFFGNEIDTRRELWFNKSDMTTHILVFGSTGAGKALKDDEAVLTPSGWVPLETLHAGSSVLTPDRQIAQVTDVFPKGLQPLWRLTFDDGRSIDATPDHLWGVRAVSFPTAWRDRPDHPDRDDPDRSHRSGRTSAAPWGDSDLWDGGVAEVISTDEIEQRLFHREDLTDDQFWAIPLPEALGDAVAVWSSPADEYMERADRALHGRGLFPDEWLDGSIKQRRATWNRLQPLGRSAGPTVAFDATSRAALVAIQRLAWSLGFWARMEHRGDGTLAEQALDRSDGLISTDLSWCCVVRTHERWLKISSIIPLRQEAPCRCIKISDPRGLFVTKDYLVTHNTESLISMAYNTLVTGSGFIYVDGKGDNGLWAKIFSVVRSLGREDDLLVINFMTGGEDRSGPQKFKPSNTMNPFTTGSAAGLTELLVGLMDEAGGDNAMWKGRAISLISAIMMALVDKRDNDGLLMGVELIRDHLVLEAIEKLSKDQGLSDRIQAALNAYLRSLPGYVPGAPKQSETVNDQHGYLQMQFTRIMGSLIDSYGHIFKTNLGEVDFFDIVLKRRILVVLLPAMEKSTDELSNLGKIIVACLKQMMATGLGDVLEGDYADVIETKPTSSPAPYMVILDEYGSYVVKGASVMPAQARSLGFCMVFAGQDYPSFKKNNNAEEAVSTIGNCNIKIFMKLEDPTETYDLAEKSIGKGQVGRAGQFQRNVGGLSSTYMDQSTASVEEQNRANWLDFKDHGPGEAHILFKSTLVRANMFYANPPKVSRLQLNSMLRVEPPTPAEMHEYDAIINELKRRLQSVQETQDLAAETLQSTPVRLRTIRDSIQAKEVQAATGRVEDAFERGMAALGSVATNLANASRNLSDKVRRHVADAQVILEPSDPEKRAQAERLHPFRDDLNGLDHWTGDIPEEREPDEEEDLDTEAWGLEDTASTRHADLDPYAPTSADLETPDDHPFLDKKKVEAGLAQVETALGVSREEATRHADQIAADMRVIASYPTVNPDPMDADDFVDLLEILESQVDPNKSEDE